MSLQREPTGRHSTAQADELTNFEPTREMIAAGLRVIHDSGALEHPGLVDEALMRRILWVALASG